MVRKTTPIRVSKLKITSAARRSFPINSYKSYRVLVAYYACVLKDFYLVAIACSALLRLASPKTVLFFRNVVFVGLVVEDRDQVLGDALRELERVLYGFLVSRLLLNARILQVLVVAALGRRTAKLKGRVTRV